MNLTTTDAFALLRTYGIHTVRAKTVDSAEDAIAFAERRNAADPRLVAIGLRVRSALLGTADPTRDEPLRTVEAIRAAYAGLAGESAPGAIVAREVVDPGTDISVIGRTDDGCRLIGIGSGPQRVERMIPLGEAGAEVLAAHVQAHHHRGQSERGRKMLEHLLGRISTFFEETGASSFDLILRLHENSYSVMDAVVAPGNGLHLVRSKHDSNAQDRRNLGIRPARRR